MRYWIFALALAGCTPPAERRARDNAGAGDAELLDTLKVMVQGGSVVESEVGVDGAPHRVRVRAQSLDVRLEVSSSGCEPQAVIVEVTHLGDAGTLEISRRTFLDGISSLLTAARAAAGGSASFVADPDDADRTPLEADTAFDVQAEDGVVRWTVLLDRGRAQVQSQPGARAEPVESAPGACVALDAEAAGQLANAPLVVRHRLRRTLADDGFAFAVWGNNGGKASVRERLLASVANEELAFVVITGDLVSEGTTTSLRKAAAALDAGLTIPWFATVGDRDVGGSAAEGYIDVLGASSFAFDAGPLRIVVLDTADATLEPTQYENLETWLDDVPLWWPASVVPARRLVLTHVAPLAPYGTRRGAFKHRPDGARLIAQLVRAKVDALIASHLAIYQEASISTLRLIHSGGAGSAMETESDDPLHWLRIRVAGDCLRRDSPECADGACDDCLQIDQVPIP